MSSISIDLAFGLVLTALVAASISAAVVAVRHPNEWHPTWLARTLSLGVGAVATLALWFATLTLASA